MTAPRGPSGEARCPFEDEVLVIADGVLEPARRFVVEAHLGVCASCAELEEIVDRAAAAIRSEPVAPLGAADAALARIVAPRTSHAALRVAAAAAVAVAAFGLWSARPGSERPTQSASPDPVVRPTVPPDAPGVPTPPTGESGGERAEADTDPPSPDGAPYVPPDLADLAAEVAALDPSAPDGDPALASIARRVRAAGTAGSCAVADLLGDPDGEFVRRALRVAAAAPSSHHVPALGRLLEDAALGPDAATILSRTGTSAAVDALARGLGGPSRAAAVAGLASVRSPRAFDALAARARSAADDDPADVLHAAVDHSPAAAARLLLELAGSTNVDGLEDPARRVLRERRHDLRGPLLAILRGSDAVAAAAAADALGRSEDASTVPALRAAAARPAVTRAAVAALVRIGTESALEAAFDAACDPRAPHGLPGLFAGVTEAAPVATPHVADERPARRLVAVEILGATGAAGAVPTLAGALDDPRLRAAAIDALGRIGGDEAARFLAAGANPRTADLRVVEALGATESAVAVPALRTLAREPALAVAATRSLGRIEDASSVVALADLLAESRTARAAAASLGALPARVVVPALLDRLDDPAAASRAHRALVTFSGADRGRSPDAWRDWWDRRTDPTPVPEEDR